MRLLLMVWLALPLGAATEDDWPYSSLIQQWISESIAQVAPRFEAWAYDLEKSYFRSGQRTVSGVRSHATLEDEIRHARTERGWLYILGLKKRYPRSSTNHANEMRSLLRDYMREHGREVAVSAVEFHRHRTYHVFDITIAELIQDAAREFHELLETYEESPHQQSYIRQQLLRKYMEVWTLDAFSILGREELIKLQIELNHFVAQIAQAFDNPLRARECQVALLEAFGEL